MIDDLIEPSIILLCNDSDQNESNSTDFSD